MKMTIVPTSNKNIDLPVSTLRKLMMKVKSLLAAKRLFIILPILMASMLVMTGCSLFSSSANNADLMAQPSLANVKSQVANLHVGDTVTITLGDLPTDIPPMEKPINEDGTINLPYIGSVKAAGKTPGQLEDIIHNLYVPKYYTHLNVTVQTSNDRVYYVRGEVNHPGRMIYTGDITVSKAITSAGDVTDFANLSKVWLTRANGKRYKLNLNKILDGEAPDPPVFPGDQIEVTRRVF